VTSSAPDRPESDERKAKRLRRAVPVLVVFDGDGKERRHLIRGREATIGRDVGNDICIRDHLVSKVHAKLLISNQSVTVVDLDSVNKTRVNGGIVTHSALRYGDEVQFARVKCRLDLHVPSREDE
jgi:pSer/pThr/pTyr-binding forkhead associated (FHA) protein